MQSSTDLFTLLFLQSSALERSIIVCNASPEPMLQYQVKVKLLFTLYYFDLIKDANWSGVKICAFWLRTFLISPFSIS